MKSFLKEIVPPLVWKVLKKLKGGSAVKIQRGSKKPVDGNPEKQDLDLYWDPEYANELEEWGKDSTWNEIQLFLLSCKGKVLDIACGTGKTINLMGKYPDLTVYGFDISDLLIERAIQKGIPQERLKVADATKTDYADGEFDYSYSIGSLEHFTNEGIDNFIRECARYTKIASIHMVPLSRSGKEEGWIKTSQSYFNNSKSWWDNKFKQHFRVVYFIPSKWEDKISTGGWFACIK